MVYVRSFMSIMLHPFCSARLGGVEQTQLIFLCKNHLAIFEKFPKAAVGQIVFCLACIQAAVQSLLLRLCLLFEAALEQRIPMVLARP